MLVTTAIHEKHTHKEYIGVDACAVDLMRPAMYGAYHHITVMGKEDAPHDHKYDVTGSLCENNDKFAIDRMLPEIEKALHWKQYKLLTCVQKNKFQILECRDEALLMNVNTSKEYQQLTQE